MLVVRLSRMSISGCVPSYTKSKEKMLEARVRLYVEESEDGFYVHGRLEVIGVVDNSIHGTQTGPQSICASLVFCGRRRRQSMKQLGPRQVESAGSNFLLLYRIPFHVALAGASLESVA